MRRASGSSGDCSSRIGGRDKVEVQDENDGTKPPNPTGKHDGGESRIVRSNRERAKTFVCLSK